MADIHRRRNLCEWRDSYTVEADHVNPLAVIDDYVAMLEISVCELGILQGADNFSPWAGKVGERVGLHVLSQGADVLIQGSTLYRPTH